jgi:hypothetical protein
MHLRVLLMRLRVLLMRLRVLLMRLRVLLMLRVLHLRVHLMSHKKNREAQSRHRRNRLVLVKFLEKLLQHRRKEKVDLRSSHLRQKCYHHL